MEAKEIRDEILISAIVKVAVYACYDGYFPDEKGVEKNTIQKMFYQWNK